MKKTGSFISVHMISYNKPPIYIFHYRPVRWCCVSIQRFRIFAGESAARGGAEFPHLYNRRLRREDVRQVVALEHDGGHISHYEVDRLSGKDLVFGDLSILLLAYFPARFPDLHTDERVGYPTLVVIRRTHGSFLREG